MLEKIKDNCGKITFVIAIVAAALQVPSILSLIGSSMTESVIVTLIEYLLFLAACAVFLIPNKDIKVMLPIANVVFYGALAFRHVYSAIDGSLSSYATAALYAAVAVLILIPSCKKVYGIMSIIAIAFFVASALGGGAISLSILLIALLIGANYYFNIEKE